MKKLLILATPRSGSSALYNAIASNYFEYHSYFEPWSKWNPVLPSGEHIVKSLIHHRNDWKELIPQYDKVIYITRQDVDAGFKSYNQACHTKNFIDKYTPDNNLPEIRGLKQKYINMHETLEEVATDRIWYYEDLFYNKIAIAKMIRYHKLNIRDCDNFDNFFNTKYAYDNNR